MSAAGIFLHGFGLRYDLPIPFYIYAFTAVAVVPSRARSRPLICDHVATRSAAPDSSSHEASMPGVWEPCPGASNASTH